MKTVTYRSTRTLRLAALFLLLIPISCDDFLEKPLQGQLTQSGFPVSAEDAVLATNATYNILRYRSFGFGTFPIFDIMSDDAHKGSEPTDQVGTIGPYDNFTHIATESSGGSWWNTLYLGIKRTNVVIEFVPGISMDEDLKKRCIGEARFMRALFYLDLVRGFGEVPLVTSTNPALGLSRAPVEDIYALIEADLTYASENLWLRSEYPAAELGRATKGAAQALFARYYLWRGDFVNAEAQAMAVINSNEYDLMPAYGDAHSEAGKQGVESVFEVGGVGEENVPIGGSEYGNVQGVRGFPNKGWGFNRPSEDLKAAFEGGDPRLDSTVLNVNEWADGILVTGHGGTPDVVNNGIVYPDFPTGLTEIEAYNQKVWTPGDNVPSQFNYNRKLIRYADVLLMAAEALNENNKTTQAETELNKVRTRVGMSTYSGETQADLREIIFHERRVELAMEGFRFWDIIRTGRAEELLGPYGFVVGKHELLPIPQSERDLAGLDQNPGWE